jgi:hypothetical protein
MGNLLRLHGGIVDKKMGNRKIDPVLGLRV